MQSRIYFSGFGEAVLWRCSNHTRFPQNSIIRCNLSSSRYQRHDWASLRSLSHSTGIKSKLLNSYDTQLVASIHSDGQRLESREDSTNVGPGITPSCDWEAKQRAEDGERDQAQVMWNPFISEKEDSYRVDSSLGGLQAGRLQQEFTIPWKYTQREQPPEMAINEVMRVLSTHGPLKFKSIAGHLDRSLPVFSNKLRPSIVRDCLRRLAKEEKAIKITLSTELRNNHGKYVMITQVHWAAKAGALQPELHEPLVDGLPIKVTNIDYQAATNKDMAFERGPELFRSRVSKVDAAQNGEAFLRETINPSKSSCEGGLYGSDQNANSLIITKSTGRNYLTPPQFLARWLDSREDSKRYFSHEIYGEKTKYSSALPTILVNYMYQSKRPQPAHLTASETSFQINASNTLRKAGFTLDDVASWARIVSAVDNEDLIDRFLSIEREKPPFLLLEILRRDITRVRNLKLLLIYTWDQIMGKPYSNFTNLSEAEIDARIPWSEVSNFSLRKTEPIYKPSVLEETTYTMILTRLLHQIRRLWPPALVSLAHMVTPIMFLNYGIGSSDFKVLDNRNHHRACQLLNHMLRLLSLPTSLNPYKSMSHNWKSQKILLELAEQFEPPLFLDQTSYRAIMRVLSAQKKSEDESKVSRLRARSWPPWRVEQDGMDAQRSLEEDFSRVVTATLQAKESGYQQDAQERIFKILGGQEPDGTPTIQTRQLIRARPEKIYRPLQERQFDLAPVDHHEWAARIVATRDVQEAWSAFSRFQEQGGKPSLSMYQAMLEKLIYEKIRTGRKSQYDASPGDGREVFPAVTDNFSKFYQQSLQPPTIVELYNQMIEQPGPRPSGRFLNFLVSAARTPWEGLRILFHSRMHPRARHFLKNPADVDPATVREYLTDALLAAFIHLLCRFAPKAVSSSNYGSDARTASAGTSEDSKNIENHLSILEIEWVEGSSPGLSNPLRHSVELLRQTQTRFRPAWYALFKTLALHDVVIDKDLLGNPKNNLLKWRVMVAALNDFHQNNLELDPDGFLHLCRGLENAITASSRIPDEEQEGNFRLGSSQILIVVNEFLKMSEIIPSPVAYQIPKLLNAISGVHIHAYVRVLGLAGDYDGIMYVLEWMVKNHLALEEIALLSRNGPKLTRRTFIAMRVFFRDTDYEAKAEELVDSVERWDGWPSEREAQLYTERWSGEDKGAQNETLEEEGEDGSDMEALLSPSQYEELRTSEPATVR